jgi:hypothetical protein
MMTTSSIEFEQVACFSCWSTQLVQHFLLLKLHFN